MIRGERRTAPERLRLTDGTTWHVLVYLAVFLQKTDSFLALTTSAVGLNLCLIRKVTFLLTEAKENCNQD